MAGLLTHGSPRCCAFPDRCDPVAYADHLPFTVAGAVTGSAPCGSSTVFPFNPLGGRLREPSPAPSAQLTAVSISQLPAGGWNFAPAGMDVRSRNRSPIDGHPRLPVPNSQVMGFLAPPGERRSVPGPEWLGDQAPDRPIGVQRCGRVMKDRHDLSRSRVGHPVRRRPSFGYWVGPTAAPRPVLQAKAGVTQALHTFPLKEKRLPKDATSISQYSMIGLIEDEH